MPGRRLPYRGSRAVVGLAIAALLAGVPGAVVANSEVIGVDVELPRGVRIEGTIRDGDGDPVDGAFVAACADDLCDRGATTNPDGSYSIRGLWPDEYQLQVEPPEVSDLLDGWYTASGPVEAQVDADIVDATTADVTGIDLELDEGHRISGTLTVQGVTGYAAQVGIEVRAVGPSSEAGITGLDGSFTIRGLRDGDYTLTVSVPTDKDGLSGPVVAGSVGDPQDEGSIVTVAGSNVPGQIITTARGVRMSGVLSGPGAAHATVYAQSADMERSAPLGPTGAWVMRGLRPGSYDLTFQVGSGSFGDGFTSTFPLGYWDGGGFLALDEEDRVPIAVAATDVTGRNANVPDGTTVSGTLTDTRGAEASGFILMCADGPGCVSQMTKSGAWSFDRVPAGSYRIQAWSGVQPGGWYGVGGYAEDEAHAASIPVGTADVGPIGIVLPDGGIISGGVTAPGAESVSRIDVTAFDEGGIPPVPPGTDVTPEEGTYTLSGLHPGWWSVRYSPPDGSDLLPGYFDHTAVDGYAADVEDASQILIEGPEGMSHVPISPQRVVDSRTAVGVPGAFQTGVPRSFAVAGVGSIPDDAWAITGNVTIVGQTSGGYLAVGPTMTATPTSSTLNAPKGDVRANNVTLPLDEFGELAAVFKGTTGSTAHVIVDITGYFVPGDEAATYDTIAPTRILDSRPGQPLRSGTPRALAVAGTHGIPSGAVAITANLTVVGQTSGGYLSVTPTPQSSPTTSTLNAPGGDVRANGLTARLSGTGSVSIVWKGASGSTADVIIDVTGYYLDDPGGLLFYPVSPGRVMDTRSPSWATMLTGRFVSGTPRSLQVGGHAFLPASVGAVTGNLTVVGQTAGGYVSVTPSPTATPSTSTLNLAAGDTRANGVTVPVSGGDDLALVFKSSSGAKTHLILDLSGYYAAAP